MRVTHKELCPLDTINEIVAAAFHLDVVGRLAREEADLLVRYLPRDAMVDHADNDIFRHHVRQLLHELQIDNCWKDDQAVADVVETRNNCVSQKEHFWNVHATDGAVIKASFQPLLRKGVAEVRGNVAQLAAQAADSLGAATASAQAKRV